VPRAGLEPARSLRIRGV